MQHSIKKILVVDDDPDILDALQFMLEDAGYRVTTTEKGEYAEKLPNSHGGLPDVILLDVLLSGEDGGEICKRLKTDEQTRFIPLVLISAHAGLQETAEKCNADGFLVKPFHLAELREVVNRLLG